MMHVSAVSSEVIQQTTNDHFYFCPFKLACLVLVQIKDQAWIIKQQMSLKQRIKQYEPTILSWSGMTATLVQKHPYLGVILCNPVSRLWMEPLTKRTERSVRLPLGL